MKFLIEKISIENFEENVSMIFVFTNPNSSLTHSHRYANELG